jgi:hypothetical protein
MIKTIKTVYEDPGIIEVEFEPFPQEKLDKIYEDENFEQLNFDNLVVHGGRQRLKEETLLIKEYKELHFHFAPMFKTITKALLELDKVRWPVFYDFEDWWNVNQLSRKQAFMVIHDRKGFDQPWHLDNRFSMWAGSINLADNETKTAFSKTNHDWEDKGQDSSRKFYEASNKKWTGTFWLNTESNWHSVPLVTSDRKAIVCNQTLSL